MNSWTNRWLVWTGPLFAIIFIAAVLSLEGNSPGEKASANQVVSYYESHQGRTLTEVFLAPLLCALLVLFTCQVRAMVRERRLGLGPGPMVLVAGSVLWASGILLGATMSLAVEQAARHGQAQVAQTMNVLSNDAWLPFIAGIAVTMLGAALTVLQTGILPRWLGWVALVAGIVSLAGPGGFVGFFIGPLWLLVAGVLLARAPRVVRLDEPEVAPSTAAPASTEAGLKPGART
ncbi:MAG: hypothetical protein JWP14_1099 [Frankiales bacterium]|nr:hypothetical protein [Frankiales bacterium]